MSIVDHLESHLGQIEAARQLTDTGAIRVLVFQNQPVSAAVTYVTLGLSDHVLAIDENRDVRQELVFCAYESFPQDAISSFLLTFADYVSSQHRALLRGAVVGPSALIIPGVALNSIYAAIPVIFNDTFVTYAGTAPPTVLVWLIPLHPAETKFVKANGWNSFEDLLEQKNPDLLDLSRGPIL